MKRTIGTIALLAIALTLVGCGGTKTIELDQMAANDVRPPDWYLNPPQDDDFIYAVDTSNSRDVQLAVDKATIRGREKLGMQLDVRLRAIESSFAEETGFQDDLELKTAYKSAVNVAVEKTLEGSRLKKKHLVREGDLWRAYVLMELPVKQLNKALTSGVNANDALREKLAVTKTFKEIGG